MIDVPRCDFSDLPLGQCACPTCKPHIDGFGFDSTPSVMPGIGAQLDEPEARISRRFTARKASRCGGCDGLIHEGDPVARTDDGDHLCEECAA